MYLGPAEKLKKHKFLKPAQCVQKRKTVYHTHMYLGSELGLCSCFPTYDGPYMSFVDTYYAVVYLMAAAHPHLELLFINSLNDPVFAL